jgi:23S rRNA (uracil1939-C5)-methyltransferase
VNQAAADVLLEVVAECAKPGGAFLVDAFCGAGFFARRLQSMFREVVGIEWSADAVRHARTDAPEHVKYLQGDVSHHLPEVLEMSPSDQTTLLVDPPAEGLPQAIIESLLLRPPARLLYVSCDPATLARDLKKLAPTHRVLAIHPVDMFPQTAQIECVAVLES